MKKFLITAAIAGGVAAAGYLAYRKFQPQIQVFLEDIAEDDLILLDDADHSKDPEHE